MRRPISSSLRRRSCSSRRSWFRRRSRARWLKVSARCRNSRPWGTGTRTSRSPAASRRAPSVSEAMCRVRRCDSGRIPRSASRARPRPSARLFAAVRRISCRAGPTGRATAITMPGLRVESLRHHPLPRVAARDRLPGNLPQPRQHGLVGRIGGVHLAVGVPREGDGAQSPLRAGEDGPQQQPELLALGRGERLAPGLLVRALQPGPRSASHPREARLQLAGHDVHARRHLRGEVPGLGGHRLAEGPLRPEPGVERHPEERERPRGGRRRSRAGSAASSRHSPSTWTATCRRWAPDRCSQT